MKILIHMLVSSACLSLFYLIYLLIYKKQSDFRELRIYLMVSVLLSLIVPFNKYSIELTANKSSSMAVQVHGNTQTTALQPVEDQPAVRIPWKTIALSLYLIITGILLGRILLQLIVLACNYVIAEKIREGDCVILLNHRFKSTFSFFRWIFVTPAAYSREDLDQIIAHEKIHAAQYHSFDLIVIELLAAVMWFNPLIWKMKNSIQLVHEYLADEGALRTGIDRLRYQVLLINQITEEKLICLSSSFNHSLIKKRLIMMTTSNIYQRTRAKLLTLIPLSASLLTAIAILNGLFSENLLAGTSSGKSMQTVPAPSLQQIFASAGDTIKKEKIVRIIKKDNQQDTVITETFTIKVSGDTAGKDVLIYRNMKEGDDTSKVIYLLNDKDLKVVHESDPDSVVWVEVTRDGDKVTETVTVEKRVEIRKDGDNNPPDNILIIIDGVKQTDKNTFSDLDPEQISIMSVINDKVEMKKYTDKAYDGIIIIETKSAKK